MIKNILIVKSIYYEDISKELYKNTLEIIGDHKKNHCVTNTYSVPGVFEIPVVISKHIKSYKGVIALGCVIKGKTPHFDFISKTTFEAIMNLSIQSKKPIGNGIITALNMSQAIQRSGDPEAVLDKKKLEKGKGREAARAVIAVLTK